MRQRFLPLTAGDMQGFPERVFAPHRRLERIGPVLRGCFAIALHAPSRHGDRDWLVRLRAENRHGSFLRVG